MIIKYFEDTDTLYVQFNLREIAETKEFDEDITLDLDKNGRLVGITLEHAKSFASVSDFSFEHILPKPA